MNYSAKQFLFWLLSAITALLTFVSAVSLARADALHGFCAGTTAACSDNGTNTPTSDTTPDFGFWDATGGSATGSFFLDFLVGNSAVTDPSSLSFSVTGAATGTASLFSTTAWDSGDLANYLGFGSSSTNPNNPIGAYLPSTQALDPGATGFYVYQAKMGDNFTLGTSARTSPTFSVNGALPLGSYIVGYLDPPHTVTATANSAAIIVSPVPEPQTYAMLLAGLGLIGFTTWRRKQNLDV